MFELNLCLADIYEAYALICFTKLLIVYVQRPMKVEAFIITDLLKGATDRLSRRQSQTAQVETLNADKELLERIRVMKDADKMLFQPLQKMSLYGVKMFVGTTIFKSLYKIILWMLATLSEWGILGAWGDVCSTGEHSMLCDSIPDYFVGAGCLASGVAIYNIVVFKTDM